MLHSFQPPSRLLMGAAPAHVSTRVAQSLSRSTISHLDPLFLQLMDEISHLIRYMFKTKNTVSFPVHGPASGAMEFILINLIEENDHVAVCVNGLYGERFNELLPLFGAKTTPITHEWGETINIERVRDTLKNNKSIKYLFAIHGDSSTGVLSDIQALGEVCKEFDTLFIVDTVGSVCSTPLYVDEWGIDIAYCNGQKSLGAPPGLSPITLSDRCVRIIKNRKTPIRSYFMNLHYLLKFWFEAPDKFRTYHHTAPVNFLYGLHEALLMVREIGIEKAWDMNKKVGDYLTRRLEDIGLHLMVPKEIKMPALNLIKLQKNWEEKKFIDYLLNHYSIQISGGMGKLEGKVLRVGALGYEVRKEDIDLVILAFQDTIRRFS